MVGKWHLGHADRKYWPQNRGFDHFYGNLVGEVDYFTKERGGVIDWQRNGKFLKEDGYYTTLIGDEAVRLIESQDASKPFFLYFASLAPHAPYQAPKEDIDSLQGRSRIEKRRTYAAMITALDDQVGRIVAALEKKGLRDNTIIIFASDNGGATSALFATGARSAEERKESGGVGLGDKPPASNGPAGRQRLAARGRRARAGDRQLAGQAQAARRQRAAAHGRRHADAAGARSAATAARTIRSTARTSGPMLAEGAPVAARRHPDQRRGVPGRDPQGQVEARQDRAPAGQDGAVRSRPRSRRDDQRRRAASGHRAGSRSAPGRPMPSR